jgi:hypothetical protein
MTNTSGNCRIPRPAQGCFGTRLHISVTTIKHRQLCIGFIDKQYALVPHLPAGFSDILNSAHHGNGKGSRKVIFLYLPQAGCSGAPAYNVDIGYYIIHLCLLGLSNIGNMHLEGRYELSAVLVEITLAAGLVLALGYCPASGTKSVLEKKNQPRPENFRPVHDLYPRQNEFFLWMGHWF